MSKFNNPPPPSRAVLSSLRMSSFMGIEIMFKILPPFVKEQLRVGLGENWEQQVAQKFKDKKSNMLFVGIKT